MLFCGDPSVHKQRINGERLPSR